MLDTQRELVHTAVMARVLGAVFAGAGFLSATLLVRDAAADGMRCGKKLISSGDGTHVVRSKCGSPQAVDHRTETETLRRRVIVPCQTVVPGGVCVQEQEYTVTHQLETWTYDFGKARLVHFATFVDGSLRDVQTGGYGTRDEDDVEE